MSPPAKAPATPGSRQAASAAGFAVGARAVELRRPPSEGLTQRDIDRYPRITLTGIQRRADIDADRPEAGMITHTQTRTVAHAGQARHGRRIDIASVEE